MPATFEYASCQALVLEYNFIAKVAWDRYLGDHASFEQYHVHVEGEIFLGRCLKVFFVSISSSRSIV